MVDSMLDSLPIFFLKQLIWGNVIFVSVVARFFTLSFVPRIVLNKLKTTR